MQRVDAIRTRSLTDYARMIVADRVVVGVVVLLGIGTALGASALTDAPYRASTSVFLAPAVGDSAVDLAASFPFAQTQVRAFATLATTPLVLAPVIEELHLRETPAQLAKQIDTRARTDAVVITISADAATAAGAAQVANAVRVSLTDRMGTLIPGTSATTRAIAPSTLTVATPPTGPLSRRTKLDVCVGALVGAVLGGVLAVWRTERRQLT